MHIPVPTLSMIINLMCLLQGVNHSQRKASELVNRMYTASKIGLKTREILVTLFYGLMISTILDNYNGTLAITHIIMLPTIKKEKDWN